MKLEDVQKGKTAYSGPSRGGENGLEEEETMDGDEEEDVDKHADLGKPRNIILVYGCKPGD